ncbi:ComEA family DNA-binding protein [Bifidobacterium biavatii]|nr:helix-hairpin-helix domain-containing protein [Bifidobacterium biavatii]
MGVSFSGTTRASSGSEPARRLRATATHDSARRDAMTPHVGCPSSDDAVRRDAVPLHDAALLHDDAWPWGSGDLLTLDPPPPPVVADDMTDDTADTAGTAETVASAASRRSRTASLHGIAGVRSGDGDAERHRIVRDRPRLAFRQIHALMAILLLTAALCASLTMLLQQSLRYESALAETRAQLQSDETTKEDDPSDTATSGGAREEPSASSQSNTNDGNGTSDTGDDDAAGGQSAGAADDETSAGADTTGDGTAVDGNAAQSNGATASGEAAQRTDDGLIDINTATSEELQTIKGIGPVTADRIIAYRKQIGRFSSVDQLLEVKGIGSKTLAKIREQVVAR